MVDIVFSDSALGSLKCAMTYGRGNYVGGATSVILHYEDGRQATEKELEAARLRFEEEERRRWEAAVPLEGDPRDAYGFSLLLSAGEIGGADFWAGRRETLERLYGCFPFDSREWDKLVRQGEETLSRIFSRAAKGEALRLWYSDQPEERCGLCWLLGQMAELDHRGDIFLVKLPDWEPGEAENTLIRRNGWGDVEPGRWSTYLPLAKKAPGSLPRAMRMEWRRLAEENAPLRAVVSGQLCSVGEDFYDPFLLRELAALPVGAEFREAALIGQTLGKHPLGIGDGWLCLRVEKLIRNGVLEALTQPPADGPAYHRMLRRVR